MALAEEKRWGHRWIQRQRRQCQAVAEKAVEFCVCQPVPKRSFEVLAFGQTGASATLPGWL